MPSSYSWSTSRNFISHALPYIYGKAEFGEVDLPCGLAVCTSSSFMNGSLAPESLMMFHSPYLRLIRENESFSRYYSNSNWERHFRFCRILVEFSSTVQFANSFEIEFNRETRRSSSSTLKEFMLDTEMLLVNMILTTRYFIRQLESVRINLKFSSKPIFLGCLPRMTALRKLLLGPSWLDDNNLLPIEDIRACISESELITALTVARNLETLEINYFYSSNIKNDTLEKVWRVNEMKHLRSLQLCCTEFTTIDNFRCISDFHGKRLTSLSLSFDCTRHGYGDEDDDDKQITPPNLAVMTELRHFKFKMHMTSLLDEHHFFEQFFSPSSSLQTTSSSHPHPRHLKYLTSLSLISDSFLIASYRSFIEKIDGSFLRHLSVDSWDPPEQIRFFDDESSIELVTTRCPLIETLDFGSNETFITAKSLELIATNLVALRELVLPHNTIGLNDEGISFLFDPAKCSGGCFATLRQLSLGASLEVEKLGSDLRGLNWFGAGLAEPQKNYTLHSLNLGCQQIEAEGFVQICNAFAHCLAALTVSMNMRGSLLSLTEEGSTKNNNNNKLRMPIMKKLTFLTLREAHLEGKGKIAGAIVEKSPKVDFIRLLSLHTHMSSHDCSEEIIKAIFDNIIEDENSSNKFLTFDIQSVSESPHESYGSRLCDLSYDCQDKLAQTRSLRCISCADETAKSRLDHLRRERPDICFEVARFYQV